jgi:membrane protease subunit HflC
LNSRPDTIQTRDRERLVVDNFAIWRIVDPLLFYKSFPTGMREAEIQIDREVRAKVREVIGRKTLEEVVTEARTEIMAEITAKSTKSLSGSGIQIADVRINRTELPSGIEENVYARMRAERERLARKHRAEGDEQARAVRAEADRHSRATIAEAKRDSDIIKGKADAKASRVYAEAHKIAPKFYSFFRSLESYKATFSKRTTLVLPPNHPYLKHFQEGLLHTGVD